MEEIVCPLKSRGAVELSTPDDDKFSAGVVVLAMSVSDNAAHSTATKSFQKYDPLFQGMRDDALYSGPDD